MSIGRLPALLPLLALTLNLTCSPAPAQPERRSLDVNEVAPGVFVHWGQPLALEAPGHDDIANIGFVVGSRCVAVIDAGGSTAVGRALRTTIRRHTTKPICFVIDTHAHVDHVLGNAAFAPDRPSFVGHAKLPNALLQSREFFVDRYAADLDQPPSRAQIILPDRLVESTLVLDLGGRRLALHAWPPAHTDSDLTVLDERTGTLWTGDLLFRERLPAIDGDLVGWLAVIDELRRVPARLAVPGHGPVTADLPAALDTERRYLCDLLDGVRNELAAGGTLEHAIDRVAAGDRADWLLWDSTHPQNVSRVYRRMEWE